MPARVFVGIGSNLADPEANVRRAIEKLAVTADMRVVATSSLYRTAPVGRLDQPDFVNAVVELETGFDPGPLLDELLSMEKEFGRQRSTRNAPRIIDLDLLIHGDQVCESDHLTLPHPRMSERAFVLVPLVEIAASVEVGDLGTAVELLTVLSTDGVERIGIA
jgi:2-amino-4-hydroxy-6-hydroxymethyldihydropteridine diphosphokinase